MAAAPFDLDLSNDGHVRTLIKRLAVAYESDITELNLDWETHKLTVIQKLAAGSGVSINDVDLNSAAGRAQLATTLWENRLAPTPPPENPEDPENPDPPAPIEVIQSFENSWEYSSQYSSSYTEGGPPPTPEFAEGSDAPGADAVIGAMWGGPESGSWLTTKLPNNTAINPGSDAAVAEIVRQSKSPFTPWINGWNDNTWTSTINVVPDDIEMVPITPKGNATQSYATSLRSVFAAGFPIPAGLKPSSDSDAELVLIQHGWTRTLAGVQRRGRLYELWAVKDPEHSVSGNWEASWGGRYVNTRNDKRGHWFDFWWSEAAAPNDWTVDGIAMDHNWGAQATSIPLSHTIITRRDIIRGVIDHPWHIMLTGAPSDRQRGPVWPAQRWDGASWDIIPQGSRLRLPYDHVVNTNNHQLVQMMETAARDYGIVHTDTANGLVIRCEPGVRGLVTDPSIGASTLMRQFPWEKLQLLPVGSDSNPNRTV